ncbi:proton-translocating NADH-quinone oxidoreductase, chain N [Pirellula staleyi DSM 6068]|uniref:NADH-quinone oxidoreductase subunit N n=1 Tax=Pirellula staleyi (strain ATCC 27377 / DSM 6068 / ICPB 4128) TaxID=530564 RepID=D2R5F7_PIRSD|nr:NADH-quinone oxidoreductase subunit N [Pirellula staleyi]ADB15416.1 proton-translocating NADH-quinone oxidoreductase, chain N [Pirellula staleyi DSM 6068]
MFVETQTIAALGPEILLIIAATAIFIGGAFSPSRAWWTIVALVSYVAAAGILATYGSPWTAGTLLTGPLAIDPTSLAFRWLALLVGICFTLIASKLANTRLASEFLGTLMMLVVGVMIVSSANELVLLFLGLELISVPTYVLLFLGRRDAASAEATMKYFFLSILASALMLYGMSFLYGLGETTLITSGSMEFKGIRETLLATSAADEKPAILALLPLALVLILAGLGFKLAAAPFQFYAPDVYQGTTNANAGLLAVAPKVAGIIGLVRLVLIAMPIAAEFAWQLALVLAIVTMTIGNVCALWQKDFRRLMAYSSIAHTGYLLIGLAAAAASIALPESKSSGGIAAMLFYVIVYAVASMGTFAAVAYLGSEKKEVRSVDELAGLYKSQPIVAGVIAVFMFSLAGIPPLAGFWGKLTLFSSAIEFAAGDAGIAASRWFTLLAIAGALNAAIAAAYYLRVISVMFFQPQTTAPAAAGGSGALLASLLCAAIVLFSGTLPGGLVSLSGAAEKQIAKPDYVPIVSPIQAEKSTPATPATEAAPQTAAR